MKDNGDSQTVNDPGQDAPDGVNRVVAVFIVLPILALLVFVVLYARHGQAVLDHLASLEPETVYTQGTRCERAGNLDEAVVAYRRALDLGLSWAPSRDACRRQLRGLLVKRGRIPELSLDSSANLLGNGDFLKGEGGADGWLDAPGALDGLTADSLEAVRGGQSLRVDLAVARDPVVRQSVALVPGVRYQASCWLRAEGAVPGVHLAVLPAEDADSPLGSTAPLCGTHDWTQSSFAFKAPAEGLRVNLALRRVDGRETGPASGTVWLDWCALCRTEESLLRNGSFEQGGDGRAGWLGELPADAALAADETVFLEGRRSLRIEAPGSANLGLWQTVGVSPGAPYRLTGWIRTESLGGEGARLEVQDGRGGWQVFLKNSESLRGTHDWTRISMAFTVPADTASLSVLLRRPARPDSPADPGVVWFDAYMLERLRELNS
jgi:Carbohydrate binding domain